MTDPAVAKLASVLGPARAEALVIECVEKLGLSGVHTVEDRYLLGCELITRGGLLEAIGRSIKIHAILHGAREV